MDGQELLSRVRRMPGGETLPVLALSGLVSHLEELSRANAGFAGYLSKPIEPSRLVALVAQQLADSAARRAPPARPAVEHGFAAPDTAPRASPQSAALTLMAGLSEALSRSEDVNGVLNDVLVHALEAAGLSVGLLYLFEPGGRLRLRVQSG